MISGETYEEVYEILKCMDRDVVNKIPESLFNEIQEKRNIHYYTKVDKKDIFNENNISKEAMDLLCYIDYNYWMSDEEKRNINSINYKKEMAEEEEKIKKYNPNDIFKNKNENKNADNIETALIEVEEDNLLEKIIKKIRNWFKKK